MRAVSLIACVVLAIVAILYVLRHKPATNAAGVTVQMGPYGVAFTEHGPESGAGGCCRG